MINKKIISLALAATMIMSTAVNVFAYDDSESNTSSNSEMFESKPLVILMDFPDYKYTELDKRESGWSINNFIGAETTPEFYNELFFGDETYTTTAGERITANKFFKEVSGESYSMKGDVFGWYTAKHNIAYYGTTQEEAAILVKEGLDSLAKAKPNLNWSKYDVEDKWDLDQDGDFNEPDGIVDCVVLIHAGMGDEMNGGSVGHDAIWPFRIGFSWYADLKAQINDHRFVEKDENGYAKGAHTFKTKGSQTFMAEDFVIFEQDLPLDLFCHEYGHNLGLPDLYAGNGTGKPPVELWALMGGSYSGNPQGSQMVGYGGVLERWLQKDFEMRNRKANWQVSNDYTLAQLRDGLDVTLTGSQINNGELDAININLPEVDNEAIADFNAGSTYAYYTSAKDNMKTYLTSKENIDLTKATGDVNLTFDAWWTIDPGFDFVSVEVKKENETEYTAIRDKNAVTTQKLDDWLLGEDNKKLFQKENGDNWEAVWQADLKERNPGWGITGSSNDEFKKLEFDLNQYKGSKISLRFRFRTDGNTPEKGMFIDDIKITDGNSIIIEDDVENQENLKFTCDENGFETSEGFLKPYQHSYTIEWRAIPKEQNVDKGLENPSLHKNNGESFEGKTSQFQYNPGLLVWYVNEKLNSDYPNQNIDEHIGEAYCGIMDAGRAPITEHWMKYGSPYASQDSSMQISDAAFSLRKGIDLFHTYDWNNGEDRFIVKDTDPTANPVYVDTDYTKFYDDPNDDYDKYNEKLAVLAHDYGLRIFVTNENEERNSANVHFGVEGGTPVIQENNSLAQVNIAGKSVIVTPQTPKNINGGSIELKLNDGYTVRRELTKNDDKTFIANFEDKNLEKAVVNYVILYETNGKATSVYNINQYKIFGVDFSKLDGKVEENKLDVNPIIKLNDEKVELADLIVGNTYDLSMEIIDINNQLTGKITRDSFTIPAEYNEIAEISESNKLIVKKLGIFKLNSTIEEQILDKWNTLASKENRITVDEVLPDLVKIVTNEKIEAAFKNVVDGKVILEVSSDEYFNAAAFEKIKELSKAKETTPDTTTPDATTPDATNPDVTNPDATTPDVTNPDVTNPDATNPDVTNPDATTPDATTPDATNPDTTTPDATNPDTTTPDTTTTDGTNPDGATQDTTGQKGKTISEGKSAPDAITPDATVKDETTPKDETVKDETVKDETVKDETVKDETVKDETVKDETVKDETVKDETVKDETVKDETVKDETVKDETTPDGTTTPDEAVPSVTEVELVLADNENIRFSFNPNEIDFDVLQEKLFTLFYNSDVALGDNEIAGIEKGTTGMWLDFLYKNDLPVPMKVTLTINENKFIAGTEEFKLWEFDAKDKSFKEETAVTYDSKTNTVQFTLDEFSTYILLDKNSKPGEKDDVDPEDPTPIDPTPVDPKPIDPTPQDPTISNRPNHDEDDDDDRGNGNTSGGGGGGFSFSSITSVSTSETSGKTAANEKPSSNVNTKGGLDIKKLQEELQSNPKAVLIKNAKILELDAIKELINSKKPVMTDTTFNNKMVARLYLQPADLKAMKSDFKLGIRTDKEAIAKTKKIFSCFKNEMAIISMEQVGKLGFNLHMAVKADLSKLNKDKLIFNVYDKTTNRYTVLKNVKYTIDANGYIHFATNIGGDIVITDQPLTKK